MIFLLDSFQLLARYLRIIRLGLAPFRQLSSEFESEQILEHELTVVHPLLDTEEYHISEVKFPFYRFTFLITVGFPWRIRA